MRVGHTATLCWYRFDEDCVSDDRLAGMASMSIATNPN
jgi:hypothetical protein